MSDGTHDRAAIADALTNELRGQADPAPPEAPAAEPVAEKSPDPQPDTPAPAAAAKPEEPAQLTDKSLVVDPVTGEQKTWAEVKNERLRWKDYSQKTMSLAEEKKAVEALKQQYAAELEAMKAKQTATAQLPDDDPYAQHIKALQAQQVAIIAQQQARDAAFEQERVAAATARLDAEIAKVSEAHKLSEREMDRVGRDLWSRLQRGEEATLDSVAKEYAEERETLRQAAIKEWQDKHRVTTPAAAASVPGGGVVDTKLSQGTRSFRDAIREELSAMMGS